MYFNTCILNDITQRLKMFRPFIPRAIYNLLTYSRIKSENDNRFKSNTSADGY